MVSGVSFPGFGRYFVSKSFRFGDQKCRFLDIAIYTFYVKFILGFDPGQLGVLLKTKYLDPVLPNNKIFVAPKCMLMTDV